MSKEPPGGVPRVMRVVDWIATAFNVISAIWVTAIAALILYDVVGREFFNSPFYGTNEIVTNSILSLLLLQLPLSILKRASLRTTIVFEQVSTRKRAIIDALSYTLAALLFLAIAVGSWPNMIEGWEILEQEGSGIINIPVYPIRTLVIVVSALCFVVSVLLVHESLTRSALLFPDYGTPDGER